MRILIAGIPRSGKTTLSVNLALEHKVEPRHTDDVIKLGWSQPSSEVARWLSEPEPWIIEGVATPRALRKWLAVNPGKPADVVHWLPFQRVALTPGQTTMANGCITVWREVEPVLRLRGVEIIQAKP